jgi:nucleoside-diphosphate-sugar epimerase
MYTVLGADGFIGSSLCGHLQSAGHIVQAVGRRDALPAMLGHVVYCIGVSSDFRSRPFDTIEANVSLVADFLKSRNFDSFTYLSSTRVYLRGHKQTSAEEDALLTVDPTNATDLYNLSKLAAENLCLTISNPRIRIARLSNVYGADDQSDNFLIGVLRRVLTQGNATFFASLESEKDYIDIRDVVTALELIPIRARSRIINVASGRNVTNREIADLIHRWTGCRITMADTCEEIRFPTISIRRLTAEINLQPRDFSEGFPDLVTTLRLRLKANAK